MNLNDYIMEQSYDTNTMDIELAQIFAEMAVVEAMMDCYNKQEMLLEYNVEAAEEIFSESEGYVPLYNSDWFIEAKTSEKKYTVAAATNTPDGWGVIVNTNSENKNKVTSKSGAKNVNDHVLIPLTFEDKGSAETAAEILNKTGKSAFSTKDDAVAIISKKIKSGDYKDIKIKGGMSITSGGDVVTTDSNVFSGVKGNGINKPNGGAFSPEAVAAANKAKIKATGNAMDVSANRKGAKIKKILASIYEALVRIAQNIIDAITGVKFNKLADKLRNSKTGGGKTEKYELTSEEMNAIAFISDIRNITGHFINMRSLVLDHNKTWTEKETQQVLVKMRHDLDTLKIYVTNHADTLVGSDRPHDDVTISIDELAKTFDKWHSENVESTIRNAQKVFRDSANKYNTAQNVPDRVWNMFNQYLKDYATEFQKASKVMIKLVNAFTSKDEKDRAAYNRGRRIELQSPMSMIADEKRTSEDARGIDNDIKKTNSRQKQEEPAAWAQESVSMNLTDDDYNFYC